jgi:hypothetical protein
MPRDFLLLSLAFQAVVSKDLVNVTMKEFYCDATQQRATGRATSLRSVERRRFLD